MTCSRVDNTDYLLPHLKVDLELINTDSKLLVWCVQYLLSILTLITGRYTFAWAAWQNSLEVVVVFLKIGTLCMKWRDKNSLCIVFFTNKLVIHQLISSSWKVFLRDSSWLTRWENQTFWIFSLQILHVCQLHNKAFQAPNLFVSLLRVSS